jgi:hypothetical protein
VDKCSQTAVLCVLNAFSMLSPPLIMNDIDCCHERRGAYLFYFIGIFSRFNVARLANEQWIVLPDDHHELQRKEYDGYHRRYCESLFLSVSTELLAHSILSAPDALMVVLISRQVSFPSSHLNPLALSMVHGTLVTVPQPRSLPRPPPPGNLPLPPPPPGSQLQPLLRPPLRNLLLLVRLPSHHPPATPRRQLRRQLLARLVLATQATGLLPPLAPSPSPRVNPITLPVSFKPSSRWEASPWPDPSFKLTFVTTLIWKMENERPGHIWVSNISNCRNSCYFKAFYFLFILTIRYHPAPLLLSSP